VDNPPEGDGHMIEVFVVDDNFVLEIKLVQSFALDPLLVTVQAAMKAYRHPRYVRLPENLLVFIMISSMNQYKCMIRMNAIG
jgi:hypothetical protein